MDHCSELPRGQGTSVDYRGVDFVQYCLLLDPGRDYQEKLRAQRL